MVLVNWNVSLSVGVSEVDQQHRKLISIINMLDDAARAGKGSEVISEILDRLIIYTATHFKTEEKYFDEFEYAEADEHKEEHATFIERVAKYSADLNSGSEAGRRAVAEELMSFLELWWKYHILETDMKYAKLFREKGLK